MNFNCRNMPPTCGKLAISCRKPTLKGSFIMMGRPLRVGTSQDVLSSFRGGYIFKHFMVETSFRTSFKESETGLSRRVLDCLSTLL